MPDVKKLPKWAQLKIETLEADVAYYKDQAHGVKHGISNIRIQNHFDDDTYLPEHSCIIFTLDTTVNKDRTELRIYLNKENKLVINGTGGIRHRLTISPRASNEIYIDLE